MYYTGAILTQYKCSAKLLNTYIGKTGNPLSNWVLSYLNCTCPSQDLLLVRLDCGLLESALWPSTADFSSLGLFVGVVLLKINPSKLKTSREYNTKGEKKRVLCAIKWSTSTSLKPETVWFSKVLLYYRSYISLWISFPHVSLPVEKMLKVMF